MFHVISTQTYIFILIVRFNTEGSSPSRAQLLKHILEIFRNLNNIISLEYFSFVPVDKY